MVEDDIVRRVVGLAYFLKDDRPLTRQLPLVEQRMLQQIGDDIDGKRDIFLQNAGIIGGVFASGIGIHLTADRLDLLGDHLGRAAPGALEQHMLQQMRDTVFGLGLVARAAAGPNAHRGAFDLGHRIGGDAQAIRQGGDPDRRQHGSARSERSVGFRQ